MSGWEPRGPDWPAEPEANHFARKGALDGGSANAGAAHLEVGLEVVARFAQSDMATFSGDRHGEKVRTPRWSRPRRRPHASGRFWWLARPLRLAAIISAGMLGVALTETAFYIFGRTPIETRLLTVGVELLIVYGAHVAGTRINAWPRLSGRSRLVALMLLLTTAVSALSVGVVRVLVIGQDVPHVGRAVEFALFLSLGLLMVVAALDAGLNPGRATQLTTPGRAPEPELPLSATARGQLRLARHHLWLASQAAYLQAYRGAAAPELAAELERVKAADIPLPYEPWSDRWSDRTHD